MGMRFNKTFKRYKTMEQEMLEKYEKNLPKNKLSLADAFKEKDVNAVGNAIVRWKSKVLLLTPCFMYLAYSMFVYTDPLLKKKNVREENMKIEREKSLLEYDDSV